MPLLQIKDFPEDLYEKLARVAEQNNRSIPQETIVLLKQALKLTESNISRRKRVLHEISTHKLENPETLPDPADLIREDRDR